MSSRELNGKEETKTNSRDFVIGAIAGAVAGAAAALLLTPRSGKEIRSTFNEQTISLLEKTDQVKNRAMKKSTELASVAKEKAGSIAQTVSQQSSDLLQKVKEKGTDASPSEAEEGRPDELQSYTSDEVQSKLIETQKAFDETEQKIKQIDLSRER